MSDELSIALLIRAREAYSHVSSDPETYGGAARVLLDEASAAGDVEAQCAALRAYGWAKRFEIAHDEAKSLLDKSVRLARRHGLRRALGEALVTRGAVAHELGQLRGAQRDFDEAATLLDEQDGAELASQRAALFQNMGRLSDAASLYRDLLTGKRTTGLVLVKAANNLAVIETMRGRYDIAMAYFDIAAAAADETGPALVGLVTESRAWSLVQSGRVAEGMEMFERAAVLWQRAGLSLAELFAEYADALTDLRLLPEAAEQAQRALDILDPKGVDLMAAEAALRVAQLAMLNGDYSQAGSAAASALAKFRHQKRPTWAARAQLVTVDAALHAGRTIPDDLRKALTSARILDEQGMRSVAVDAYLMAGRVASRLRRRSAALNAWSRSHDLSTGSSLLIRLKGKLAAALHAEMIGHAELARRHTGSGLDDLAKHRAAIASSELKALASGHGQELGRIGLAARVGYQPASKVLDWMERTRAAALAQLDVHESEEVGDDLGELRAAQAELVAARRETGREPPALRDRLTSIEQRMRRATWTARRQGSKPGTALRAAGLRQSIGERVLVEYDVLDGELIAAVLDSKRTRLVRLGLFEPVRQDMESLLFTMRYLAGNAQRSTVRALLASARSTINRLKGVLLDPLQLPEHTGAILVPVRELHQVPWAAMHSAPVSLAPSASMWVRSKEMASSISGPLTFAAGPELPGAAREVEQLAALHDGAVVLTPPASTVDAVARALNRASLAHLACHCFIRTDSPRFSSLLLSDGYLTVHELDQRADVPHRVILAACESGNDVSYDGNEVLGFVSTLMGKGCAGVIASSIVVPDHDVLPLMRAVHKRIAAGATLAEALHAAQNAIDPDDPRTAVAGWTFNAFGAA